MIEQLPKELDPKKFRRIMTGDADLNCYESTDSYEKCLTRTMCGEPEAMAFYQVKRPDGAIIFVLAESADGAASQACTEDFELHARDCEVKRVPFRYRGWGHSTF